MVTNDCSSTYIFQRFGSPNSVHSGSSVVEDGQSTTTEFVGADLVPPLTKRVRLQEPNAPTNSMGDWRPQLS